MFVRKFLFALSVAVVALFLIDVTWAQTAIQIQEGTDEQDIISATPPVAVDTSGTTPGPGASTGTGQPPRVGPNRQVNDVQQGFPHGLFGRSETTVAATTDGQFLVFGWNDAQEIFLHSKLIDDRDTAVPVQTHLERSPVRLAVQPERS